MTAKIGALLTAILWMGCAADAQKTSTFGDAPVSDFSSAVSAPAAPETSTKTAEVPEPAVEPLHANDESEHSSDDAGAPPPSEDAPVTTEEQSLEACPDAGPPCHVFVEAPTHYLPDRD